MELRVLNTSVAIAASDHNPTILHPAFLEAQNIVADVELAEPPFCTPAVAVVKYANGLIFNVEPRKFLVTDNRLRDDFIDSVIPALAIKYIEALPHVRYTGAGINMTGFMECLHAETFTIDRFIKPGEWNDAHLALKATSLQFTYEVSQSILRLSCQGGKVRHPDIGEREGLVVTANYHSDLSEMNRLEDAKATLNRYPERYKHFIETTRLIFGLEG